MTEVDDAPRPADLRLVPPALATWLGMWLTTGWTWGVWATAGTAAAVGLVALALRHGSGPSSRRRGVARLAGVVALMLGAAGVVGGVRVASLTHGPLALAAAHGSVLEATVTVRSARPAAVWGMAVADATCREATIAGVAYRLGQPVVAMVPADQAGQWLAYPAGTVVRVTVRAGVPETGDGEAAVFSVLGPAEVVRGPPGWQGVIESMRSGLVAAVAHNPPDQAGLVPGLVVGDTSAMSAGLMADFKATGLTHLVAVSGANLAIMLTFLTALAKRVGVRGHGLTAVSVVGIAGFIALCHSEPSVLRAAAMGVVALAAVGRGAGPGSGARGLALAIIGLCWIDPWMSRSVGFILSVLACAGIIAWGATWSRRLGRWLPEWAAQAMAIPLAAQVATQPVICWLSGAVSVAGLMANAAAAVWVAPATVIGLVTAVLSVVSPLVAGWTGYVAGWCAQPILTIGQGLAGLPGASHPWPVTPAGLAMVTVCCGVVVWLMPHLLSRAWAVIPLTVVLVATMLVPPFQPGWPGRDWVIAACDVGQGDAVVIRAGPGEAVLIDVGPADAGVTRCLGQLGVRRVPLLVLTHLHADHTGALAAVLDAVTVGQVLLPPAGGDPGPVMRELAATGTPVTTASGGLVVTVGQARILVVSAWRPVGSAGDGEESSSDNDGSLIVRVDVSGISLLDTGDVEVAGQQAALADPAALRVDVLKVPHHGSSRQDPGFLAATGARIALISVGESNPYGHPADKTVKALVGDGMTVVRTDRSGSITISAGPVIVTQK